MTHPQSQSNGAPDEVPLDAAGGPPDNGVSQAGERTSQEVLVELQGLTKAYRVGGSFGRGQVFQAVSDITFSIRAGETFGLVGETGSGKSTTGRLALGLERPTAGKVVFADRDLALLSAQELRALRRRMQPISQDPYSALNGRMHIEDILAEPFVIHKVAKGKELRLRIESLLELVGLPRDCLERFPHQFSGGQRQRLVIARAIALRPEFIVADEPLSALDVSVQAQIINLLRHLQSDFGLTYLFISHDLPVVRLLCDTVGVMYMGKLVELASRDQLFGAPAHPYTHALLAAAPIADPAKRVERKKLHLAGEAPNTAKSLTGCVFHPRCPLAEPQCVSEEPPMRALGGGHQVSCHFGPVSRDTLAAAIERQEGNAKLQSATNLEVSR